MGNQEAKMSTRVDLLKSSQNLYDFLREVDANPALYSLLVLKNAVQRYETFWLPLMAEQGDVFLPAPLDIEYVWCCHMLSPYAYMKDCQLIAGKVVDHVPHSCYEREQLLVTSRQLWTTKYAGVSFEVDLTNVNPAVDDSFVSKCSYDIISAALRQRSFNYNSSLPHFRDEKFLAKAIRRYATMLMIIRDNPGHPVVPCYDNDLVWHAHQLHPATYNHDTTGFLGAMLNHDDDRCDRSPGSQLSKSMADTRALWKARQKPFGTPGGMYRGDPPAVHYSVPTRRELLHNKMYKLRLQKLQLRNFPRDCDQRLVSMIRIFIVNRNFTVTKIWSSQLQPSGDTFVHSFLTKARECAFDYDPTNSCALRVSLTGGKHVAFQVDLPLTSNAEVSDSIPDIIRFAMNIRCDAMGVLDGEMHLLCDQIADFSFTVKSPPGKVLTAKHLRDAVYSVGLMVPASLFMQTARCQYSDHQVSDHLRISSFTWRIVHCKRPALSVIEVLDNCGHVVSTGHTIGSQSLPRRKQVRNRSLALCHDPSFERAILIRSSSSDWGILKASWHGFVKPQAGVSGSAGQLKLSLFVLKGADSSFATIGQSPAAPHLFTWGTPHGECSVDLQSGRIRFLGSVSCVAENICLAGAIALAFVLCQPRPRPGKTPSDSAGLGPIHGRNSARSDVLDGNTMPLLVAGGLYSNSIPRWYHADTHGDRFYQILPDYSDKIVGDFTYDYDNGDIADLDDGNGLPRSRAEVGGWDVPLATVSSAIPTRSRSRSGRGKVRTKAKAYGGDFYGGGGGCGSGDGFGGGACGNLDGGGGGACGGGGCGSGDGGGGGACGGGGCGGGGS